MFKIRRFRAFRRRDFGLLTVAILLTIPALTNPADADDKSQTVEAEVSSVPVTERATPKGSGPKGCEVEVGEGIYRRSEVASISGENTAVSVVEQYLPEGIYGPPAPQGIDVDQLPDGTAGTNEVEPTKIVDGKVELDGVTYNIYTVKECDTYEDGQQEVVLAPPATTNYIPALQDSLVKVLPIPTLELLPFDKETNSTYVQTAVDFRSDSKSLATRVYTIDTGGPDTATLESDPGTEITIRRWMTITATPRLVTFDSGDPLAPANQTVAECSPEAALEAYIPETPGECSYQYRNASSVVDGNAFQTSLSVEWDVTYIRNDGPPGKIELNGPTINDQEVRVGELQVVNVYD